MLGFRCALERCARRTDSGFESKGDFVAGSADSFDADVGAAEWHPQCVIPLRRAGFPQIPHQWPRRRGDGDHRSYLDLTPLGRQEYDCLRMFRGHLRIPSQALEMGVVIMKGMRMWETIRTSVLGRHAHEEAYAALVLSGGYEEAGDNGRFQVKAGDVVFHGQFEAHLDRFSETGAVVLNLPLPPGCSYRPGIARVADPDSVARMAERSRREAIDWLLSRAISKRPPPADRPDELAAAMIQNLSLKLSHWGKNNGITTSTAHKA